MAASNQGTTFLKGFKDFVTSLQNLWGILAGISVLFPLSGTLAHLIPLETSDKEGVLVWFSPALFTTLATLVSLFLILWTFGQRRKFQSFRGRSGIQRQAGISFVVGLAAFIVYLVVYYFILRSAYDVLGWESADIRRLIGEVPLLILYGVFFALITRAFMLLGMVEYFRREK